HSTYIFTSHSYILSYCYFSFYFLFFPHPATTEIYTLSLHDALPISACHHGFIGAVGKPGHLAGFSLSSSPPPPASSGSSDSSVSDRKSTRLNSSHVSISYAVFCLKKKNK